MIHCILCGKRDVGDHTRCLKSIEMQSLRAICHVSLDDDRRLYLVRNTWETILRVNSQEDGHMDDEDILAFIDLDDFLCDENALQIIQDTYAEYPECLLTYGTHINLSSNKVGKFNGEYGPDESVRHSPWRASHLKTCKYKLWKKLPEEVLKWPDGRWFKCAADRTFMMPLIEMAGWDRTRHIDWRLYCYDDTNPQSVWKTKKYESIETREYIEAMPSLERVEF